MKLLVPSKEVREIDSSKIHFSQFTYSFPPQKIACGIHHSNLAEARSKVHPDASSKSLSLINTEVFASRIWPPLHRSSLTNLRWYWAGVEMFTTWSAWVKIIGWLAYPPSWTALSLRKEMASMRCLVDTAIVFSFARVDTVLVVKSMVQAWEIEGDRAFPTRMLMQMTRLR